MGRHPWTSRLTVEESRFTCRQPHSIAVKCSGFPRTSATVSWPLSNGSSLGSLRFEIRADWRGPHLFILRQLSFGGSLRMGSGQTIRLTATRPHWGGERFWFCCECGRRSGRLYLPAGETVFRCRPCYELTYRSAQEHNTRAERDRELIEYCRQLMASAEVRARNPPPRRAHRRPLRKT